jgi:hypothetical protein
MLFLTVQGQLTFDLAPFGEDKQQYSSIRGKSQRNLGGILELRFLLLIFLYDSAQEHEK